MTEIAYILLAHKGPQALIAQIRTLTGQGDKVALHYDLSAPAADFALLKAAFAEDSSVVLAQRVRCGWGEWSLVAATLNAARAAMRAFPAASHFYMVSGDCMPIKPRAHIARMLSESGRDYIEHHDFFESAWIKVGLKEERLIYRHWVNERKRKRLFYTLLEAQKRLGLSRSLPEGLRIQIGSQWWVLRRATLERVLDHIERRPEIVRFFCTTWIPDETFFQTLVLHLTPRLEVENRTLTFLAFSDYGMPLVLYDDHAGLLEAEGQLFARKISPNAAGLRERLTALYAEPACAAGSGGTTRALYRYLTQRGRAGRRHGERIWEAGAHVGAGREVLLVLCKKWHVAKRLAKGAAALGIRSFGHLFDENDAWLPPLGNLATPRVKREWHRRAFLHVLFDATGERRLLFCADTARADIAADLMPDPCEFRVLEIDTGIDDAYLEGHAVRVGLIQNAPAAELRDTIVGALRRQFQDEAEAVAALKLP
ncbi:MAG TPA: DUF5928 domain-containing protein, partial [Paracoccaceae bacterium]|nr:DUF5928 domain-containing protein [Paracoccaceae bacterium]